MKRTPSRRALLAAAAALAVPLGACGSGDPAPAGDTTAAEPTTPPAATTTAPAVTGPVGPGCGALPAEGEGSTAGMADDPLATAAANNPLLTHFTFFVQTATLVDSLNTTEDITVLAPVNPAFEAVPREGLDTLVTDTARLTAVLTHHVIAGRLGPEELAGTHATLAGDEVAIEGSGQDFTIAADQTLLGAADATVTCGNIPTANATVYLVDQVLAPAA
ncbi:fasciclin domain-containing protein [Geodermatophilus sp. SYSU D00965]